ARRRENIESLGTDLSAAGMAEFNFERARHHELACRLGKKLVFEARLDVLESIDAWLARGAELRPCGSDRDTELVRDPLGELGGNVEFPRRGIVAVLEAGDGRQRKLVGDTRIVDAECSGKEPGTDDTVGVGGQRDKRDCEGGKSYAREPGEHRILH